MRISSTDKSSPLRNFIETEHQQAGLYSLPGLDSLDASDIQKKRRRKCGVCGPCLLRKNCGNCGNCLNRKTGKQICKLRKCDSLKKRRDETERRDSRLDGDLAAVYWTTNQDSSQERRVDYPEDASALSLDTTRPTAETVCRVTSVDGPRSGGQMEIGSHDRLQEGASNLNLANGVSRYANGDEAPMEEEQHRQGWVPGQPKVSDSQQHHNWTSRPNTTRESIQHVDIEDARNLVAFSTTVSRPASTSSSAHVQQNTSRLYEKFTQEMGEGEQVGQPDGLAKGSCQGPDDLDTLQTALSQAKHGHKPPNCNCDGPDCPDYLEWLEKKIKLATDDDKAPCSKSITHTQQTNGNGGPSTFPQQQQGHNPQQAPGSKPPIPCSPQVLSIAKERNVSLQTAIAIEALTQLSGTGSQASGSLGHYNNNLHQTNLQNHPTNGIGHSFSRSQSVPPGLHTGQPAQDQRPQSQGPPPHASPLQSSTSPFPGQGFNPHPQHPQHWQQGAGQGEQRNMWMGAKSEAHFAPHGNQDPMSELKQLLGDHTGKFDNAPFRLPVQQNMHPQANIALDKIKKEQDSSEHYPMDPYGMANGHQHYPGMPMSPNQAAIRHSTQAALQQHLHYKRNLFSNHSPGFAGPREPNACQNLKKWWPQEVERQQQPVAGEDKFCMPSSPFPKRMKFETSGDISVLSTTCYSEDDTPTKDFPASPSLKGFLESPLRYLDTPTKNLLDTPSKDLQAEFPICNCVEQILEKDEGPYYNHLGAGPTVASIRTLMETRYGQAGEAVRIEKAVYTGREGKSSRGCPIAKWVIRRGSEKEKLLCLVRQRPGHHCDNAVIIILIMAWEGVPSAMADKLYREVSDTLTQYGNPTSRRCGLNDDRTCACQGKDPDKCGASFSFGCSWSMYFNGCKYARSKIPRKFRLQGEHPEHEDILRDNFQNLATEVAPLYKRLAPQAYSNQCLTESTAPDCRLGLKEGRPFSGITACMDFCAHAHKDQHNLYNGCTVVCTLTKEDNRKVGVIPEDEQLHVLPLYKISPTDEFGSEEGQRAKMKTGALQILQAFRREVRKLPEPAKSCRQRRLDAKKAASEKKKNKLMAQTGETPEKVVIKTELRVTSSPQLQGNKAVIKQEVKPIIKKEPFNGSLDGYPVQSAEALNIYPQAAYYARGGLPPTGQPSSPSPVNGYHPNLHYGYYNCPPNALFRPKIRTYERKAAHVDTKPDVQSLQACLSQPEQNVSNNSAYTTNLEYQSRPSSVSSEHTATPVIKQEPMDLPVHEAAMQSPAGGNTPSTTPQPGPWPGHKFNGNIVPPNLNSNPSAGASMLSQEHKQFHQHPQQRASPFPQQWYPGSNTPMGSPSPLHAPPSPVPSPHLMNPHNMHSASPRPTTPRPSTPHPGTPQPAIANSGQVPSQPGTPRPWSRLSPSPQANPWAMAPGGYSPVIKHNNSRGAFPDKMWSESGERCSTPVDPQEKAWKSYGGSAASTTPSPAPEGRLFPDALQQTEQACWDRNQESDVESCKGREDDDDEVWSDSEHNFLDPSIGGVAVAPAHGSILIECARRELHATTPLKRPDRTHPTRISLVFYQHKNLNQPNHGLHVWEAKMKLLAERTLQRQQEAALLGLSQEDIKALGKKRKWGASAAGASPGPGQTKDKREGPVTRLAPTFHTTSMVQVSPYAFTQLTGPYSRFV
uniref:Methylcytosine dioxygenase TET n=1 Tax=Knipowitschia caucasica TaxID=637954 RepID=A0AAV2MSF1_KNICA